MRKRNQLLQSPYLEPVAGVLNVQNSQCTVKVFEVLFCSEVSEGSRTENGSLERNVL